MQELPEDFEGNLASRIPSRVRQILSVFSDVSSIVQRRREGTPGLFLQKERALSRGSETRVASVLLVPDQSHVR